MNFIADENIEAEIVRVLRAHNHHVEYVAELHSGLDDVNILNHSFNSDKILLTQDKDFGELVYRNAKTHCGIILIRLHGMQETDKAKLVLNVVTDRQDHLHKSFIVIQKNLVRIRTAK